MSEQVAKRLERLESIIYTIVGGLLGLAALVIIGYTLVVFVRHVAHGGIIEGAIELLEQLLLALMSAELLYTVTISLRTHSLYPEPFLIVGLVAAVRRILTISVEASQIMYTDPEHFRMALTEIGLLTVAVLILVFSIYLLRRCRAETHPEASDR